MIELEFNSEEKDIKINCEHILTPQDITKQCKTEDEFTDGVSDYSFISCCNDNGPNSIVKYFENHFADLKKHFFGKIILNSMCLCCKEKGKKLWTIEMYAKCVKRKLKEYKINWHYE